MNIIRYSLRSFFTNEYYSIIRFASKRLFVATLISARCTLQIQGWMQFCEECLVLQLIISLVCRWWYLVLVCGPGWLSWWPASVPQRRQNPPGQYQSIRNLALCLLLTSVWPQAASIKQEETLAEAVSPSSTTDSPVSPYSGHQVTIWSQYLYSADPSDRAG